MAKNDKHSKRVKEINDFRITLPATDFEIRISDTHTTAVVTSYGMANLIIQKLLPEMVDKDILEAFSSDHTFASLATAKEVAKKLKISIVLLLHKNYKK